MLKIIFTPKPPHSFTVNRFFVTEKNLPDYIGSDNAITALKRASLCRQDKVTVKFRKAGKLEIYFI
jgi:hypothetical protein